MQGERPPGIGFRRLPRRRERDPLSPDVQLRIRKVRDVEVSAHVPVPQTDARVQSGKRYSEDQVPFPVRQQQLVGHSLDVETRRALHRNAHVCSGRTVDSRLDQSSGGQKKGEGKEGETEPMQRQFHGQLGARCLIASEPFEIWDTRVQLALRPVGTSGQTALYARISGAAFGPPALRAGPSTAL